MCDLGQPPVLSGLGDLSPSSHAVPCALCHAGPQFRCLKKKEMTAASDVLCEPALVPSGICLNPNPTVFWGQYLTLLGLSFLICKGGPLTSRSWELHRDHLGQGLSPERFPWWAVRVIVFICPLPWGCQPALDRVGWEGGVHGETSLEPRPSHPTASPSPGPPTQRQSSGHFLSRLAGRLAQPLL